MRHKTGCVFFEHVDGFLGIASLQQLWRKRACCVSRLMRLRYRT